MVFSESAFKIDKVEGTGNGEVVPKGANVTVHYHGTLADGTVFDSSVERGEPFKFTVGVGQVIKGWDEGIVGLEKGQKAKLTCPPDYAYGSRGAGGVIPPNATLTFDVEVIDFKVFSVAHTEEKPVFKMGGNNVLYQTNSPNGFNVETLRSAGAPFKDKSKVPEGADVTIHYKGYHEDGTVFDDSLKRGDPLKFRLGAGQVIRGFEEAVPGMEIGQKVKITCPPDYAYGERRVLPQVHTKA